MRKGIRTALVICGTGALVLGSIGIVVPVLPTTPFLLLAAACYARGSVRLHDWLVNSRLLGEYIRDYRDQRAIKRNAKILAIAMLWLSIGISVLAVEPAWVRILLCVVAAAVTAHLLTLRTIWPGSRPQGGR